MLTLHAGDDVEYYVHSAGKGGADYYLSSCTDHKEPPGFWAGKGAEGLGLAGEVNPRVMRALYHHNVLPDGTLMDTPGRSPRYQPAPPSTLTARIQARVKERIAELGFEPLPEEVREIELEERVKHRNSVAFFDFTLSLAKSVSLVHASHLAGARRATDEGDEDEAARCKGQADRIEDALRDGAREVVASLERTAAFVRTGHHGEGQGQWRDARGLTASVFVQHTNREGEPQLHAHVVVLNRARRADGADERWRTLDSRSLHRERLRVAADANMAVAARLARLGYRLVKREDGNGFEVGGVEPATMRAFSARRVLQITPVVQALVDEYTAKYGREPSLRALWSLKQQATIESRRSKHETERTPAESLAAWEARTVQEEVQALGEVRRAVADYATVHEPAAPLTTEEMHRAVRIAVAEVQRHHAAWTVAQLAWELWRALPSVHGGGGGHGAAAHDGAGPDLPPGTVRDLLGEALTGRIPGAEAVSLAPWPDVSDVSMLGVRASDGASVYRPPGEARYCTIEHLDAEEWLIKAAGRPVRQAVTDEDAAAAAVGAGLDASQGEATAGLLTTKTTTTVLMGAAGTGKTHVVAKFAEAWTTLTGGRVIGLATSTNAARQLAIEGLPESHNIARFLGRLPGTDVTRGHIPLSPGDVLVVDEGSQVPTVDLVAIQSAAVQAGARVVLTGDTAQLSSVGAGGVMAEVARRQGYWKLHEVRRFAEPWEARASLRLREGDVKAWLDYKIRARIYSGEQGEVYSKAVRLWLSDVSRGHDALLLAGSNNEAAELARLARREMIAWKMLDGRDEITLADGNEAGTGDLIRARLNVKIDAGGQQLTNRDTLRIEGWRGAGDQRVAVAVRKIGPGEWSRPFEVPATYLEQDTELDYAGNVAVAQGKTVRAGHLIVSDTLTRESLYTGMTRGWEENLAHVVTAPKLLPGMDQPEMPPAEAVLASVMKQEGADPSATRVLREAQDWPNNTRHMVEIWQALSRGVAYPSYDEGLRARLPGPAYERYLADPQRPVLQDQLLGAEMGGHDVAEILDQVTGQGYEGAHSIAAVLHGRIQKLGLSVGNTTTWEERSPRFYKTLPGAEREAGAGEGGQSPPDRERPGWAQEIEEFHASLDPRQRELGAAAVERPPVWAVRYLGMPPTEPGLLRDDWAARAGIAASYREAVGHTDPEQAIGPVPAGASWKLEAWEAAVRALEMQQEERARALPQRELEARVQAYGRAAEWAPRDVGDDLESTRRAERDTLEQADRARQAADDRIARGAEALAADLAERKAELSIAQAARDEWNEATAEEREKAREAKGELERRGVPVQEVDTEPEREHDAPVPPEVATGGREWKSPHLRAAMNLWRQGQEIDARAAEREAKAAEPERETAPEPEPEPVRDESEQVRAEERQAQAAEMERWELEQSQHRTEQGREADRAWQRGEVSEPEAELELER
jgi:conjugative relaxase-like TrwC/TraI family protein